MFEDEVKSYEGLRCNVMTACANTIFICTYRVTRGDDKRCPARTGAGGLEEKQGNDPEILLSRVPLAVWLIQESI